MHFWRRKHFRSLSPDFLSDLPDNIIDVILMRLPCIDAVRTSILSKKWRYHWCRRTELTLDETHWRTKNDLLDPTVKFEKIICQLLSLHEGPITEFTLKIACLKRCPKIDNFIYFLSRNDIQHLVLHLPKRKSRLASSLFTCSQLRHLTLHDCRMRPPSVYKVFDWLIRLELCRVRVSSKLLGSLISQCPLLEQLVLKKISQVPNIIEINAPKLRFFDFSGNISSIYPKNVPLLAKISLTADDSPEDVENFGFARFFESCSALEHVIFNSSYGEWVINQPGEVATRLPFVLDSVKRFYITGIVREDSYQFPRALCLIRSFPHLEYLKVEIGNEVDLPALKCLEMERFSDVTFNHLLKVTLKRSGGTTLEMQLIKLLLAKSPVLTEISINIVTRETIHDEVLNFPRASREAKVVFRKEGGVVV